jgi:gamma-glutamyl-gamma-aminobutyrate hydrolase PuuD
MSKIIGIVATSADDYIGVHKDLMVLVNEVGYTSVIIPPMSLEEYTRIFKTLDGILLPGGPDIDTKRYNERSFYYTGSPQPLLEHFDNEILPEILDKRIPVFGICRGFQSLNIIFGGTLNQHLFWHPYSSTKDHLVHEVEIFGNKKYKVNSFHHQGIKKLAPDFDIIAVSKDGIIEAIQHKTLKIAGVQWHPERSFDEFAIELMKNTFA